MNGGAALFLAAVTLVTLSGIDIQAIRYVTMKSSNNITIENSTMTGSSSNPGINMKNTSYGTLRNNVIIGTNSVYQDLVNITGNAHHNLLDGNLLGLATGDQVLIDINGAGNGWHIDGALEDGSLEERGRIDLLSVVYHELGHVLGLGHEDQGAMQALLAPGDSLLDDAYDDCEWENCGE